MNSKNILAIANYVIRAEFSLTMQQNMLDRIDEAIGEIRTDIISGGKTADEINVLLDNLQALSIKRYHVDTRIKSIKRMHEQCGKQDDGVEIKEVFSSLKSNIDKHIPEEL